MTLDERIKASLGEMVFLNLILQQQLAEAREALLELEKPVNDDDQSKDAKATP